MHPEFRLWFEAAVELHFFGWFGATFSLVWLVASAVFSVVRFLHCTRYHFSSYLASVCSRLQSHSTHCVADFC